MELSPLTSVWKSRSRSRFITFSNIISWGLFHNQPGCCFTCGYGRTGEGDRVGVGGGAAVVTVPG